MSTTVMNLSRRQFIGVAATSTAVAAIGQLPRAFAGDPAKPRRKTILSFYLDDTKPGYTPGGVKAYQTLLDFCREHGAKGDTSCILGMSGHSATRKPNSNENLYLEQAARAATCGIDLQMELMTHGRLFDFEANVEPNDEANVACEGLWMHQPKVTVKEYERYFQNIIDEGKRADIRFTGITCPGCGCPKCVRGFAELRGDSDLPPLRSLNLWKALLNLAKKGQFRGPTVTCFFDENKRDFGLRREASDGQYGVYQLFPNTEDRFGSWENNPKKADADYYITEDGKSGITVRHVEAGEPYSMWYCHWQGVNSDTGVGWKTFMTVVERINKHLKDRVVWMRPNEITERYHNANGWSFLDEL
jgi:hypothetical protein